MEPVAAVAPGILPPELFSNKGIRKRNKCVLAGRLSTKISKLYKSLHGNFNAFLKNPLTEITF